MVSCVKEAETIYKINKTKIKKKEDEILKCDKPDKISKLKIHLIHLKHIIFGNRKNYKRYIQNKINKQQYKENKLIPITIHCEAKKFKNRLFDLDIIQNNCIIFKTGRYNQKPILIQLPKLRNNIKKQLYKLESLSDEKELSYSVKLTKTNITLIFDENKIDEYKIKNLKENRILGIDLNPLNIGFSILDFNKENNFEIIHKELIDFKSFNNYKNKTGIINNKKKFETIEIVKYITEKAKHFKCSKIIVEDLNNFDTDLKIGKRINYICNNIWNKTLLINNLTKRCNIYGIELVKVNTAYSSFIGNIQYGNESTPDPVASSIEIARRGFKKYDKGWFYSIEKNVNNLKNLWKKDLDWSSLSWKELFNLSKESKLKYRFSLDENLKFLRFYSYKSCIQKYSFI
jgi:IS605 OrfB family transposase